MNKAADNKQPIITLASASPRRRELLEQIGVCCEVLPVDIDESHQAGESAEQFVKRLALQKACEGFRRQSLRPVIGSDTIVVLNDEILGKPKDRQDGIAMLHKLAGQHHHVMTAVALCQQDRQQCLLNISRVEFAPLSDSQIDAYWQTGEPADKAGAYGIQGIAAQFIRRIEGSYSAIMGLPLYETAELLKQAGIELLESQRN